MRKRYVIYSLIAVLIVSLSLNLVLFNKAKESYIACNKIRLDPSERGYYPQETSYSQEKISFKTVAFFGDSRANDWRFPTQPGRFQFINRGITGQTSAQVIARFDYHIKPLQPRFIVVQVGINDLKMISFSPERRESIITNCKNNISGIVTKSLDLGSTVILTTIFPLGKTPVWRSLFWSDDMSDAITDVNDYLYSLKGPNVFIVDTAAILADEKGTVRKEYSKDFLHINAAGYTVLNNDLLQLLSNVDE